MGVGMSGGGGEALSPVEELEVSSFLGVLSLVASWPNLLPQPLVEVSSFLGWVSLVASWEASWGASWEAASIIIGGLSLVSLEGGKDSSFRGVLWG